MSLIRCNECGRSISTRATACVGCGAPLSAGPDWNWVPARSSGPAPTRRQILGRALLAILALAFGVIWASALEGRATGNRVAATLAALLVIIGLCGCVVALLQSVAPRR